MAFDSQACQRLGTVHRSLFTSKSEIAERWHWIVARPANAWNFAGLITRRSGPSRRDCSDTGCNPNEGRTNPGKKPHGKTSFWTINTLLDIVRRTNVRRHDQTEVKKNCE
jgi:hypothetical protein